MPLPASKLNFCAMAKSHVLYAVAKEIGQSCANENRAFFECKERDESPEACLEEGGRVQECALGVLKSAMATCEEELSAYSSCLDMQISEEYMFERCRTFEHSFRDCRSRSSGKSDVVAAKPAEEGDESKSQ